MRLIGASSPVVATCADRHLVDDPGPAHRRLLRNTVGVGLDLRLGSASASRGPGHAPDDRFGRALGSGRPASPAARNVHPDSPGSIPYHRSLRAVPTRHTPPPAAA